jgi:hypothetical protein
MKIKKCKNGKLALDGECIQVTRNKIGEPWLKIKGFKLNEIKSIKNFVILLPK